MKTGKYATTLYRIFIGILVALTIVAFIKSIFVSFDLDEGYALSCGYRMAMGDHFFNEMWEPHQLSAYPIAILSRIFLLFSKGSTKGIVIFLRIIGCLIHASVGFFLYKALTSYVNKQTSLILAIVHCLFLPKWLQLPEFELMQYWYLLLIFVCFSFCYKKQLAKVPMLILAGIFTLLSMTTYPTMCLLFIPGILVITKSSFTKLKDSLIYSAGFFGSGILFLIYVFCFISPSEFVTNLKYIFMDESHTTETAFSKALIFGNQILGSVLINIVAMFIAFIIVSIVMCLIKKLDFNYYFKNIVLNSLILSAAGLLILDIINVTFFDVNVYTFTHFYYSLIILGFYVYFTYKNTRNRIPFICLFIGALVSVASIMIMTNMSINVIISHLFPACIAVFIFLGNTYTKNISTTKYTRIFTMILMVSLLGLLLFSRLIAIRVNGCLPVTIRAGLEKMEDGPLAGIYVVDDDAYIYNGLMNVLSAYEGKKVLYVGGETWLYTYMDADVVSASTQGTSSYNDAFIAYYDIHPELTPDVIIIDNQLESNPAYTTTTVSDSFRSWVLDNYPNMGDENFATVYTR